MEPGNDTRRLPPYLPYRTFQGFVENLVEGVPDRIDRTILKSMSGSTQNQLMTTLRYLKLTDQYGNTTAKLEELVQVSPEQRKQLLADLLRAAYPFLFNNGFNLEKATMGQLEEQFRNLDASVETARKNVSFFLAAAKDAGIPLSVYLSQVAQRSGASSAHSSNRRSKSTGRSSRAQGNGSTPPPHSPAQTPARHTDLQSKLIDKYPDFDPTWADDVKKMWFAGFGDLMKAIPKPSNIEQKTAVTSNGDDDNVDE